MQAGCQPSCLFSWLEWTCCVICSQYSLCVSVRLIWHMVRSGGGGCGPHDNWTLHKGRLSWRLTCFLLKSLFLENAFMSINKGFRCTFTGPRGHWRYLKQSLLVLVYILLKYFLFFLHTHVGVPWHILNTGLIGCLLMWKRHLYEDNSFCTTATCFCMSRSCSLLLQNCICMSNRHILAYLM